MALMLNQKPIHPVLRWNLSFAFVEGLLVLGSYLKQPSEPGSAVFLGFSFLRLALILLVLLSLSAIGVLLWISFRNSRQAQQVETLFSRLIHYPGVFWAVALWMLVGYSLIFLSEQQLGSMASYRERLLPAVLWLTALGIQFGFSVIYLRGDHPEGLRPQRGILVPALALLALFGILFLFIKFTGMGLTADQVYWQGPGTPLLLPQVFLAALAGVLFYLLLVRTGFEKSTRLDVIVFVLLWAVGSLLWLNQPARLTWFSMEPTPPNYQNYPFSDALVYDHAAREYLIGKPILSDFWAKPFYSFFLTILHIFVGGNYNVLIALQVILLAIAPALSYLFGARLGNRPAGLILGLLLILRERNALALSNVIQVSHVKLLLSDVFAMGFMVLLLWLFFHWLDRPLERRGLPLVLGGILSLLALTRGHPILLLPFLLFAIFLVPFPRKRLRWEAVALAFVGCMIPLLPWFWRNYELTQKLAFQYPVSPYSALMSMSYSFDPAAFDPQHLPAKQPGESDLAYYDRLQKQAVEFAFEQPVYVAQFISAHYFHNLIFSFIYLPHSFRIEELGEYVKTEPFWDNWQGQLPVQAGILLGLNMGIVALGFGTLWKRYKYLALVPWLLGIGYNLSVAVGRLSGWRFILPADWITLIYYAVGLMQIYHLLRSLVSQGAGPVAQEYRAPDVTRPLRPLSLTGYILFLLLISVALTQGHKLFSQRYPAKSATQLKEDYQRAAAIVPSSLVLDDFLESEAAVILYGQAHNPSFLAADKMDSDDSDSWPVYYFWPNYRRKPFPRLIFNLSGPRSAGVILPLRSPPASFPDGTDVIVVGCSAESGEIHALAVLLQGSSSIHYTSEPFPEFACPVSTP